MANVTGTRKRKRKGTASLQMPDSDWDKKYNIERDLDAVVRAEAVKKDPERMKLVKQLAKEKLDDSKRREEEAKNMVDLGEGKDI